MSLESNMKGTREINLDDYCDIDINTQKVPPAKEESEIKIEVLFPELCNLFGDSSNMTYLKKCLPKATFIETDFTKEPTFLTEEVDMIYLGPMTEKMQEKVIKKLMPHKNRIKELIQKGIVFLLTGNSLEVFGTYIENEDGTKEEALGLFPIHAKRDRMHRHNSRFIGKMEDIELVGFKSQFTFAYGDNKHCSFAEVEKGIGLHPESNKEGIRINNCMGTYLLGPILILNPDFTKKIIQLIGIQEPVKLAFEEDVQAAYYQRLKEFQAL